VTELLRSSGTRCDKRSRPGTPSGRALNSDEGKRHLRRCAIALTATARGDLPRRIGTDTVRQVRFEQVLGEASPSTVRVCSGAPPPLPCTGAVSSVLLACVVSSATTSECLLGLVLESWSRSLPSTWPLKRSKRILHLSPTAAITPVVGWTAGPV
jgi:hypothetical protein